MMTIRLGALLILFAALFRLSIAAQPNAISPSIRLDTLYLTLDSAENIFLRQNLALLAQRYQVDAQQALILQARLYPNPNLTVDHGLYNTETKTFFPLGDKGETAASISQLILLAGKRNKQIKMAQANARLSAFELYDLLRTLKYTLRINFFNIYYLLQSSKAYDDEIRSLQLVVTAFEAQKGKGYISEKEVIRIKAQLYSLQSEYKELLEQVNDQQSELRLVLQVKPVFIYPLPDINNIAALDPSKYPLATLLDTAFIRRSDLLIAKTNTDISKLNYNYQKALAIPDVTLNMLYDQQGSYIKNYNGIGVGIDLPVFNRNQGNIKSAKVLIDFNMATQKSTEATVEEQVYRALQKTIAADQLYKTIDPAFSGNFQRLEREVLVNYQKRNITMLDFLDFYDAYKQHVLQVNSIQFNRISAFEELNFVTGSHFFN